MDSRQPPLPPLPSTPQLRPANRNWLSARSQCPELLFLWVPLFVSGAWALAVLVHFFQVRFSFRLDTLLFHFQQQFGLAVDIDRVGEEWHGHLASSCRGSAAMAFQRAHCHTCICHLRYSMFDSASSDEICLGGLLVESPKMDAWIHRHSKSTRRCHCQHPRQGLPSQDSPTRVSHRRSTRGVW